MAYDAEATGNALQDVLEDGLADALDAVETAWASDPVTLADPETWFFGHKPTVLEMESSEFPFVAVVVADRIPQERPTRWGYQEVTLTVYVDYFVVADDETTVNKYCHRYAQAICQVLQEKRIVNGYAQQDYEPQVNLSEASRHGKETEADFFDTADVDFIQGGRVTVTLEGAN
jgi:hypothetical protein